MEGLRGDGMGVQVEGLVGESWDLLASESEATGTPLATDLLLDALLAPRPVH